MSDTTAHAQSEQPAPAPRPDLKQLDTLVGTWDVTGGARGKVTYEWMEGGFFMIQHVDLEHDGRTIKGFEIIGHEQRFGAEPSDDIMSRYYDYYTGATFDYVYELDGDTFMIWGGAKGSPAYYQGTFSADRNACTGSWVYPGGGGYVSNMIRRE